MHTRRLYCAPCGEHTGHTELYAKNDCGILRCNACGLGRADITNFEPMSYYTTEYFCGGRVDGYSNYAATEPVLRRQFAREVAFIRRHCRGGRLIEIGCAYGFFLQEAKHYFAVAGVELSEAGTAHCQQAGLEVVAGTADERVLEQLAPADVFVLLDVIEHLPDPFETLLRCKRYLQPGGCIVLTTGDFGSILARAAGKRWRLMTPPQHLWFFTREAVRRWGRQAGMRVDSFDHPWKIVPLSLMAFQLGRGVGWSTPISTGTGVGVPVNLFDAMRVVLRKEV
jgi:SAM-dependent methyltransferase